MMKKMNLLLVVIGSALLAVSTAEAQSNISVGGGVGYGSHAENANVQVNAYYRLSSLPMRIGGDLTYRVPDKRTFSGGESRTDVVESNLNLHLMAVDEEIISLYGITGLNTAFSRFKTDFDDGTSESVTDTVMGINVGAGGEMNVGGSRWFGEVKYLIRDEDSEFVVGAGVRFRL